MPPSAQKIVASSQGEHALGNDIAARRPAQGPAQLVDANLLDPEVLALWQMVPIDQMNLEQLDLLEINLRRLAV